MLGCYSHSQLFVTLWTVSCQTPLSMGFSRQEYWSGFSCPPPGDLPNPGIKPTSLMSSALQGGSLPLAPPGKSKRNIYSDANVRETYFLLKISSVGQATLNHVFAYMIFKVALGRFLSQSFRRSNEWFWEIYFYWSYLENATRFWSHPICKNSVAVPNNKEGRGYGPAESSLRRYRLWQLWTFTVLVSHSKVYNWLWSPVAAPLEPLLHHEDYAKSITTSLQGISFSIPSFLYKALSMKPFIKIYRQSRL